MRLYFNAVTPGMPFPIPDTILFKELPRAQFETRVLRGNMGAGYKVELLVADVENPAYLGNHPEHGPIYTMRVGHCADWRPL